MFEKWTTKMQKLEKPFMIIAGAMLLTVILSNVEFNLLEANLYDFRMIHGLQPKADPQIVLITLDEESAKALDEISPLPLDIHARFMEALEKFNPKGVGYIIDFTQVNLANPDLTRKDEWANRFVDAANRFESRGIPVLIGTPFDVTGEIVPPYPFSSLRHSIAVIHKDGNVFAEDKITRRALTQLNGNAVFHTEFAQLLREASTQASGDSSFFGSGTAPGLAKLPNGTYSVPEIEAKYFFFMYHGGPGVNSHADIVAPYTHYSFVDVLRGNLPPNALNGKIILLGSLFRQDPSDFAFTPFSRSSFTSPKLVVHANILDSLIHNEGVARAPQWINWLSTFVSSAIVIGCVMTFTPLYGVFSTIGLALLLLLVGQILFQKGIWLRESSPLVGTFVSYYLIVPYRLIREYKQRWDYQRKNEVLTQVEELKSNFLSLVTHDLKTPVARIQGLAEVLLRKANERLIDRDKETLHHIVNSTDELNRFISSILELSKVESDRLHLNLESKDVNQIIEKILEDFKAQARSKKIRLVSNLEPLFPIKLDAQLIKKVLNNLVDNALKYSPAGSEVCIESREVDVWVEISVRDQGIGLTSEEREKLFSRFYRAKNDTTTVVGGTGLGLYLTKFFVEAHQGRVDVTSEPGVGSTFKIFLPLKAMPSPVAGISPKQMGLSFKKRSRSEKPSLIIVEKS